MKDTSKSVRALLTSCNRQIHIFSSTDHRLLCVSYAKGRMRAIARRPARLTASAAESAQ